MRAGPHTGGGEALRDGTRGRVAACQESGVHTEGPLGKDVVGTVPTPGTDRGQGRRDAAREASRPGCGGRLAVAAATGTSGRAPTGPGLRGRRPCTYMGGKDSLPPAGSLGPRGVPALLGGFV